MKSYIAIEKIKVFTGKNWKWKENFGSFKQLTDVKKVFAKALEKYENVLL
jgi:hypothetical protein